MTNMTGVYERDLDLNLLRVLVVVADAGSVTAAAGRLYVTQPAISAALRRLTEAVGARLFVRSGRRLALTARGRALVERVRPLLEAIASAARDAHPFDPRTATRTLRLGLADASERWLLPPLLRYLGKEAPGIALVALGLTFRNAGDLFARGAIDLGVGIADDVPSGVTRKSLFHGGFVCLFDPRHAALGSAPTRAAYLAASHVVVSYNADLRGVVEDLLGERRRIRASIPSFHGVGAIVEGSDLVATVPATVAADELRRRPRLCAAPLPLPLEGAATELFVRSAVVDDPAVSLVVREIERIAREVAAQPGLFRRKSATSPKRTSR